jgi:hypothetical protein
MKPAPEKIPLKKDMSLLFPQAHCAHRLAGWLYTFCLPVPSTAILTQYF